MADHTPYLQGGHPFLVLSEPALLFVRAFPSELHKSVCLSPSLDLTGVILCPEVLVLSPVLGRPWSIFDETDVS